MKNISLENQQIPEKAIYCLSGLVYLVLEEGSSNERPGPEDSVRAIITPKLNDANFKQNNDKIQTLLLTEVGAGLSEAFQLMNSGQKLRVWIPATLQGKSLKENKLSMAIYDLELIDFQRLKEPPSLPNHLISPSLDK